MTDLRGYARLIEAPLAMGDGQAAGIDPYSGKMFWVPADTWRISGRLEGKSESAAFLALNGVDIRIPIPLRRQGSFNGYAILSCHTLAVMFDAKNPPSAPLQSVLDGIQEVKQKDRDASQAEPMKPTNKGGRKPSQDMWRPFWIEVSRWAAKHDLVPIEERRPELRRHMLAWAAGATSPPPSESSIERALSDLFYAVKTPLDGL